MENVIVFILPKLEYDSEPTFSAARTSLDVIYLVIILEEKSKAGLSTYQLRLRGL